MYKQILVLLGKHRNRGKKLTLKTQNYSLQKNLYKMELSTITMLAFQMGLLNHNFDVCNDYWQSPNSAFLQPLPIISTILT